MTYSCNNYNQAVCRQHIHTLYSHDPNKSDAPSKSDGGKLGRILIIAMPAIKKNGG